MEVIGNGFLAQHLRPYFADRYADVVVIAAGVSSAGSTEAAAFDREALLVYDVVRRCRADGRTVVFFSTASTGMYSGKDCPGTEDGPVFPHTPYGRHKLALEQVCALSGIPWLVLRLGYIVGPDAPAEQLLPALTKQVLSGSVRILRGAERDLLDVRHLLLALDRLLAGGRVGEVVNVATGSPVPIERILDALSDRLGTRPERHYADHEFEPSTISTAKLRRLVPELAYVGLGDDYLDDLLDSYLDDTAAVARRGLTRAITPG